MAHLSITQNQGFHLKSANGFTVSVQFGPYSYCASRSLSAGTSLDGKTVPYSANAEVAVFHPNGELLQIEGSGEVRGWVTPDDVVRLLSWAASQPADAAPTIVVPASVFVDGEK